MLPPNTYLGMLIVNRHRKEMEGEAAAYRLWRSSSTAQTGWLAWALRGAATLAVEWLSAAGRWLDGYGPAGGLPPLDDQMRPSD
jgi:hypothetical protein